MKNILFVYIKYSSTAQQLNFLNVFTLYEFFSQRLSFPEQKDFCSIYFYEIIYRYARLNDYFISC